MKYDRFLIKNPFQNTLRDNCNRPAFCTDNKGGKLR